MKNKSKNGVRKMTEEDYNNYVMALKDEKPIKGYKEVSEESNK